MIAAVHAGYYAGGALPSAPVTWNVSAVPSSWTPPGWEDGWRFGAYEPPWWGRGWFDEGRRFASTDAISGDLEPATPFMIGIWEIAPEGTGTRYTARARHWSEDDAKRHLEMGFMDGWGACADQLVALCELR